MATELLKIALAILNKLTDPTIVVLLLVIGSQLLLIRILAKIISGEQENRHTFVTQVVNMSHNVDELANLVRRLVPGGKDQ